MKDERRFTPVLEAKACLVEYMNRVPVPVSGKPIPSTRKPTKREMEAMRTRTNSKNKLNVPRAEMTKVALLKKHAKNGTVQYTQQELKMIRSEPGVPELYLILKDTPFWMDTTCKGLFRQGTGRTPTGQEMK